MHNHMVLCLFVFPSRFLHFFSTHYIPQRLSAAFTALGHALIFPGPMTVCLELFLSMGVVDALSASSVSALFASAPRDLYRHEHFVSH